MVFCKNIFQNLIDEAENNNVRRLFPLKLILISLICGGCASKTSREIMEEKNSSARPRPAAYGTDNFYLDNRSPPDRQIRQWDFFYKHCKLVGRDLPTNKADWDCTDPR
jgi:hypothetical protein